MITRHFINFIAEFDETGAANLRLGDSGKGPILIEGISFASITSRSDGKNIILEIDWQLPSIYSRLQIGHGSLTEIKVFGDDSSHYQISVIGESTL